MRKYNVVIVVALLAAVVAGAFLIRGRTKTAHAGTPAVASPAAVIAPVTRGNLSSQLKVAGQFTAYQEVDLHAKVSGYIRRIYVDIGDRVRAGQVIARLEVPELNAQVTAAQAQVRHSQSEISRAQSEVERAQANHAALHAAYSRLNQAAEQRPGLIAEQELDDVRAKDQNAEAQVDAAKASLDAVQQQLGVSKADEQRVQTMSDYSVVVSPFNGVITRRYADTGSLIQAGTASNTQAMPVVRVAQSDLLRLRMPVPETDVRYIQAGAAVQVTVQAISRTFPARIKRFTRSLDASTRTMLAEVDVPNSELTLSPGMYAETAIILQHRLNILSIPSQAIVQDGEHAYALFVNPEKRVEKRTLQLGIEGGNRTEIKGKINQGDSVIVSGQTIYREGELVRPQQISEFADSAEAAK